MMESSKRFRLLATYSAFIGLIYIIFGALEFLASFNILNITYVSGDILGGFTLIVIGGILLNGFKQLYRGETMGLSYPLVGTILGLGIGFLFTLVLLANATERYILMNPDYSGWSIMESLRPDIYLTVLLIPIAIRIYQLVKKERIVTPV